MSDIHRYRRFKGWDYSKGASLFVTIATAGEGIALYWKQKGPMVLPQGRPHLSCDMANTDGQTVFEQKELKLW